MIYPVVNVVYIARRLDRVARVMRYHIHGKVRLYMGIVDIVEYTMTYICKFSQKQKVPLSSNKQN